MKLLLANLFILALLAVHFSSCGDDSRSGQEDRAPDLNEPTEVLQVVFDVANGKSPVVLGTLCDPLKENDLDTQRICDTGKDASPDAEFVLYFKDAKITGEPLVKEDTAWVPFEFGPSPSRADKMQLIRRHGKWYLFSF